MGYSFFFIEELIKVNYVERALCVYGINLGVY